VTSCLENFNTVVDHPGAPFARAKETLALVEAVARPGPRMILDPYHAQIGEGNLIELLDRANKEDRLPRHGGTRGICLGRERCRPSAVLFNLRCWRAGVRPLRMVIAIAADSY